jgi:hypothetical protein
MAHLTVFVLSAGPIKQPECRKLFKGKPTWLADFKDRTRIDYLGNVILSSVCMCLLGVWADFDVAFVRSRRLTRSICRAGIMLRHIVTWDKTLS